MEKTLSTENLNKFCSAFSLNVLTMAICYCEDLLYHHLKTWIFTVSKTEMPIDLQLSIKDRGFKMPFYPNFLLVILASAKSEISLCIFVISD